MNLANLTFVSRYALGDPCELDSGIDCNGLDVIRTDVIIKIDNLQASSSVVLARSVGDSMHL
jgi:hypothetical protein